MGVTLGRAAVIPDSDRVPIMANRWRVQSCTWVMLLGLMTSLGCQLTTEPLGLQNDELAPYGLMGGELATPPGVDVKEGEVAQHTPGREKEMISLPTYVIEPPDILLIDVIRLAPKPPYHIQTMDILNIFVAGTPPDQPISGAYQVEPSGIVSCAVVLPATPTGGNRTAAAAKRITDRSKRECGRIKGLLLRRGRLRAGRR